MIINLNQLGRQEIESTVENTRKMRLSEHASSMVFQMFTRNVYSNPIGSIVREIASNCFDSHIEAGVNFPVIIRKGFEPESEMHYISFIDNGVGISTDRMQNIYGVYFESTKRIDNEQIGGFGIGCKVPLAYKRSTGSGDHEYDNSFYVITNYEGRRYYYMMYEGTDSPIISLLYDEETTERNGTEVRVPILMSDLPTFAKECVRQLYYFENVIFEGFEEFENIKSYSNILMNEYQIVRAKNFLFRGTENSDYAHVCLGRVAYPIDFSVLGLASSDYQIPIAIKLEIGDVNVTASRESLDYSKSTIAMLTKKLDEAKAEIKEMLSKQYSTIHTLEEYFKLKTDYGKLEFSNGVSIFVGNLIKQSEIDFSNFRYSFMKMPNDKQLFKLFFNVQTIGETKKKKHSWSSDTKEFEGGYKEILSKRNILYLENDVEYQRKIVKSAYLKSEHGIYHIITPKTIAKNYYLLDICSLFNVHLDNVFVRDKTTGNITETLIPFIASLVEMQEEYFNVVRQHCDNYDTLEVPEEFLLSRKRGTMLTEEMRKLSVPVMFHGGNRMRVLLKDLFDANVTIYYGTVEDSYQLAQAKAFYLTMFGKDRLITGYDDYNNYFNYYSHYYESNKNKKMKGGIMFIQLAVGNVKYMKYCRNAHPVNEFKHRMVYRKVSIVEEAYKNVALLGRFNCIDSFYKNKNFALLSESWYKMIDEAIQYVDKVEKAIDRYDVIGNTSVRYFCDVDSIKPDKKHEDMLKKIEDILFLQAANKDILKHVYHNNGYNLTDSTLVSILNKIMIL